jgi:hypothetical protein
MHNEHDDAARKVQITETSKRVFMAYAKDAGNWSGTPLVGGNVGGDKAEQGNLTQLKQAELITTQYDREQDSTWIYFTDLGKAWSRANGFDIDTGEAVEQQPTNEADDPYQVGRFVKVVKRPSDTSIPAFLVGRIGKIVKRNEAGPPLDVGMAAWNADIDVQFETGAGILANTWSFELPTDELEPATSVAGEPYARNIEAVYPLDEHDRIKAGIEANADPNYWRKYEKAARDRNNGGRGLDPDDLVEEIIKLADEDEATTFNSGDLSACDYSELFDLLTSPSAASRSGTSAVPLSAVCVPLRCPKKTSARSATRAAANRATVRVLMCAASCAVERRPHRARET